MEQNKSIIENELLRASSERIKNRLQGLLYVLDQLLLPVKDFSGILRTKSSMPFNEALEYFLAFQPHHSGVPTKYQRGVFREALLHEKHGLRINIIRISERSEYVALRPENVDLEPLLLHVFNDINDNSKISDGALVLDKETLQGIVSTMDSEWDNALESYYGQYTPGTKCKALVLILITFPL